LLKACLVQAFGFSGSGKSASQACFVAGLDDRAETVTMTRKNAQQRPHQRPQPAPNSDQKPARKPLSQARGGFPRSARLLTPAAFQQVFEQGGRHVSSSLVAHVYAAQEGQGAQLGLVVSKKVSKRAVVRNRIKRALRQAFRHWNSHEAKALGQRSRLEIILLARTIAAQKTFVELESEARYLLKRATQSPTPSISTAALAPTPASPNE
jgi:ribonuclease P protein component